MNEIEAARSHDRLVARLKGDFNNRVAEGWPSEAPTPVRLADGCWIFVYKVDSDPRPQLKGQSLEAIVVRPDGQAYLILGACARVRNLYDLGQPLTQERFLGSTSFGRYQRFDRGIAIWEGGQDLGYCIPTEGALADGRTQQAFAAFSDLRGFTGWSRNTSPREIQRTLSCVESCLQRAFSRSWCSSLFVKGTGDGIMMVSELSAYRVQAGSADLPVPGHARDFTRALCRFVQSCQEILPRELAVGVGVDFGECQAVFILGRYDYLGEPINNAAKIQQLSWNEVTVSHEHAKRLDADGVDVVAVSKPLPGRGLRLDPRLFLDGDNDVWGASGSSQEGS